jgi:putative CocE/NonD family hydrolase
MAENLLSVQHPAVKAAAIQFSLWDAYADSFPGGMIPIPLVTKWGQAIHALDLNQFDPKGPTRGVRPVDEDTDGALLREAMSIRGTHQRVDDDLRTMFTFRDDKLSQGYSIDDVSPHRRVSKEVSSRVPILSIDGYYDGNYASGAIKRFTNVITPGSCLILGPWNHGALYGYDPDQGANISQFPLTEQVLRFFDHYLKDLDNGIAEEPRVHYFTLGKNLWTSSESWPPAGITKKSLYLGPDLGLLEARPTKSGRQEYSVDLEAHTAMLSRYNSVATANFVDYPDRRQTAGRVLSYTSAPLQSDLEVTGQGLVSLFVSSDQPDGQFIAYLEVVHPDGRVSYVSEGGIRALHHKVLKDSPPYLNYLVYHSYKKVDAQLMTTGETEEIEFDLQPVSYVFEKGSRIRVSFAGADALNFTKVNDEAPNWKIRWGGATPSRIELPVGDR